MRIYFVRHGNPNYEYDCLTEIGHLQAASCAKRLKDEGIQKIYSSSMGRAMETALHTANTLKLEVEPIDFIKEIFWYSKTGKPIPYDGHPWYIVDDMTLNGENLFNKNWIKSERFSSSVIDEHVKRVTDGLDKWLKDLGYEREGDYYRVVENNKDKTIAVFCHAGSLSAALSHLLGLPFPWVLQSIRLEFTSITVIDLEDEINALTFPRLTLLNDYLHIKQIDSKLFFGN